MRKLTVSIIVGLLILSSLLLAWLLVDMGRGSGEGTICVLPTRAVLPSLTPSKTPTHTLMPTNTPTATPTPTVTFTTSATSILTATHTPTLATRVIEISAVMPGVYLPATSTAFPLGTVLLPEPPYPVEPMPDATHETPPYMGWYSFESDHPSVQYSIPWVARQTRQASQGQYHRSDNMSSAVTFHFEGEGLRIRYVAARNMGMFEVIVDGVLIETVDAYAPELQFIGTQVYFVGSGAHSLTLRNAQQKNNASQGYVIGLDAIQVFRGTENTLIIPPSVVSLTPTEVPRPVAGIALVQAPVTVQPTVTDEAPSLLTVSIIIAYDENGNREVDPAEGVSGISVRAVEIGTNRVIAQAFTDGQGYVQLQVVTSTEVRVVVPYFGTVWDVPRGRTGGETSFSLLLSPGNQPGLIP